MAMSKIFAFFILPQLIYQTGFIEPERVSNITIGMVTVMLSLFPYTYMNIQTRRKVSFWAAVVDAVLALIIAMVLPIWIIAHEVTKPLSHYPASVGDSENRDKIIKCVFYKGLFLLAKLMIVFFGMLWYAYEEYKQLDRKIELFKKEKKCVRRILKISRNPDYL